MLKSCRDVNGYPICTINHLGKYQIHQHSIELIMKLKMQIEIHNMCINVLRSLASNIINIQMGLFTDLFFKYVIIIAEFPSTPKMPMPTITATEVMNTHGDMSGLTW